jgi:hypothetical protein
VAVTRQQGRYFPTATNTHAKMELLDAMFSMRSVSYQILNVPVRSSHPQQRGFIVSSQTPSFIEEEAPFQNT